MDLSAYVLMTDMLCHGPCSLSGYLENSVDQSGGPLGLIMAKRRAYASAHVYSLLSSAVNL
jgi:hypothetical protein